MAKTSGRQKKVSEITNAKHQERLLARRTRRHKLKEEKLQKEKEASPRLKEALQTVKGLIADLKARQDEVFQLKAENDGLKAEMANWERRVDMKSVLDENCKLKAEVVLLRWVLLK